MKIRHLLIGAISSAYLALAPILPAQNWEAEVGLTDPETLGSNLYDAQFTYFFRPLAPSGSTPLAEQPFTERVSSLSFDFSTFNTTFEPFASQPTFPQVELEQSMDLYGLSYIHRSPSSPHSFGAGFAYQRQESERVSFIRPWFRVDEVSPIPIGGPTSSDVVIDRRSQNSFIYLAEYNYYIQEDWTLGATAALFEEPFFDRINVALNTKRIWTLKNNRSFILSAALTRSETKAINMSDDRWNVGSTLSYYFSPKTGLSFGLELPEGGDTQRYELGIEHFLTQKAFVRFGYNLTKIDFDLPDGFVLPEGQSIDDTRDEIEASVGIRF